jgi:hypothetical protein
MVISPAEGEQIEPRKLARRNGSAYVETCTRKMGKEVTASGSGDSETTIRKRREEPASDPEMRREKKEHDISGERIIHEQRCRKKSEAKTMATANPPSTVRQNPVEKIEESTDNTKQAGSYPGKDNGL